MKQRVVVHGSRDADGSWEMRDFLRINSVDFDWVEVDVDGKHAFGEGGGFSNSSFPILEFTEGDRLFAPTLSEVAQRLGFVTKPDLKEYDLSIYGAGPAGLSAAVYAASEGLRTVLIERRSVGGQAATTSLIENYMGFPDGINGAELAMRAKQQAEKFGVELVMMQEGVRSSFHDDRIWTDLASGSSIVARANICATGVEWRSLDVPGQSRFLGRGVYFGAGASEASLCRGEDVCVVGGGNSAGQAAMHLSSHARSVTLLVRGATLSSSMSKYLSERILACSNIFVRYQTEVAGFVGDSMLEGVEVRDSLEHGHGVLTSSRVFIAIGGAPNTDWTIGTNIMRDAGGYLVTGPDLVRNGGLPDCWSLQRSPFFLETSVPGSFAIGDVRHRSVKRVATAVGEGAMAVSFVHRYLEESL